jgi:hypothetical protein
MKTQKPLRVCMRVGGVLKYEREWGMGTQKKKKET